MDRSVKPYCFLLPKIVLELTQTTGKKKVLKNRLTNPPVHGTITKLCKGRTLYNMGGAAMKSQAYEMAMLFDFYGELLTDRQKELFDLYYNEDLSLSEIAENTGITRQGARDAIVRAEGILTEMEEKTGMVSRFLRLKQQAETMEQYADQIDAINNRMYHDRRIGQLTDQIRAAAGQMKE
jgi:hypothetical protein